MSNDKRDFKKGDYVMWPSVADKNFNQEFLNACGIIVNITPNMIHVRLLTRVAHRQPNHIVLSDGSGRNLRHMSANHVLRRKKEVDLNEQCFGA